MYKTIFQIELYGQFSQFKIILPIQTHPHKPRTFRNYFHKQFQSR